jgi:hypothetical protein
MQIPDFILKLKPSPIPIIHPVREYLAGEEFTAIYEKTKAILQVPLMGVVTMAFTRFSYKCCILQRSIE